MNTNVAILIGVLVLVVVARAIEELVKAKSKGTDTNHSYKLKRYFFSKNEHYFYKELLKITIPMNLTIFAKPRLADIIKPQKDNKNWQTSFNKISSKHVDFLLCDNSQIKPTLIIELDDKTHDTKKRTQRDTFVDSALNQAGIPILHVRDTNDLQTKINSLLISPSVNQ